MATIKYDDGHVVTVPSTITTAIPGHGRTGPPLMATVGKVQKVVTGQFSFDASYPAGGEDISDIFNLFGSLRGIVFEPRGIPLTLNAKIINSFPVDYSLKKVLVFGDDTTSGVPAEVANATDLSLVIDVRFIAWGDR